MKSAGNYLENDFDGIKAFFDQRNEPNKSKIEFTKSASLENGWKYSYLLPNEWKYKENYKSTFIFASTDGRIFRYVYFFPIIIY